MSYKKESDEAEKKAFAFNHQSHLEAHAQFGPFTPLENVTWFHAVGWDAGVKFEQERMKEILETANALNEAIIDSKPLLALHMKLGTLLDIHFLKLKQDAKKKKKDATS